MNSYDLKYLICYRPRSYKGCHKEKFTDTYVEALKFKESVEKRGSTVLSIYSPGGDILYDIRRICLH